MIKSKIKAFNPLLKFLFTIIFILFIVLTPIDEIHIFLYYGVFILFLVAIGSVDPVFILKRVLVIGTFTILLLISLPFHHYENDELIKFLFLTLSKKGILIALNTIVKAIYSVMLIIFLSSNTENEDLINTFHQLGLPDFIISVLSLMMRYFSLLFNEGQNLIKGRNARFAGKGSYKEIRVFGHIIGVLFLKTLDAGEKIYDAMEARMGNGMVMDRQMKKVSFFEIIVFFLMVTFICFIRIWGDLW